MEIRVGTFNVNNLFSRWNFRGEIGAIEKKSTTVTNRIAYEFSDEETYRLRTYQGKLVKGKAPAERAMIAQRIREMDVDVLALQEVEDIDTLREFVRKELGGLYGYVILVEGNDPRLIDVALLSKLPIGAVTSWQAAVHPEQPEEPVFGRDLLEVDILDKSRDKRLFTIFNNHLKSHYADFRQNMATARQTNDVRRTRQAEMIQKIVGLRTDPGDPFLIMGDMNDSPDSKCLAPFIGGSLNLVNALRSPAETGPSKKDKDNLPAQTVWTHRFKESGKPARYELYDQIWISPVLGDKLTGAWIQRRRNLTGDGSDHDPAWISLGL